MGISSSKDRSTLKNQEFHEENKLREMWVNGLLSLKKNCRFQS